MKNRALVPSAKTVTSALVLSVFAGVGCQRNPEDDLMSAPPPPPAAMIAPISETMTLEQRLQQLHHELDMALIRGRLDEEAEIRLYRAEAITDRLLEVQPPFEWLAEGYDLNAWLRQLQSLADRIVSKIRREEEAERIVDDAIRLRRQVIALREVIAAPGGEPPIALEALLSGEAEDEYLDDGEPRLAGSPSEDDESTPSTEPGAEGDDDGPRLVGRPVGAQ